MPLAPLTSDANQSAHPPGYRPPPPPPAPPPLDVNVTATAPITGGGVLDDTGTLVLAIPDATETTDGIMSAVDKTHLDQLVAGQIPIAVTAPLASAVIAGTTTLSLPVASESTSGAMSGADKTKLDNITVGTRFIFHQDVSAATWTINHNLNTYPTVVIITSAGDQVEVDYVYTSLNQVVVNANAPFSGTAILT